MTLRLPMIVVLALAASIGGSALLTGMTPLGNFIAQQPNTPGGSAEAASLPLPVVDRFTDIQIDGAGPSGSNLRVEDNFVDPENHCEFCTRVSYTPGLATPAGFAFASNVPVDVSGAKKIQFWVTGEDGGEKVKFKVAGKKDDTSGAKTKGGSDIFNSEAFGMTTQSVTLKKQWQKFEVDLGGADLKGVNLPLAVEFPPGAAKGDQVIYIKGIVLDDKSPESDLLLTTDSAAEEASQLSVQIISHQGGNGSFKFSANVSGGEKPFEYVWDFGDGEKGHGSSVSHSYEKAGTYNMTLDVADGAGNKASDSTSVAVAGDSKHDLAPSRNDRNATQAGNASATSNQTG